MIKTGSARSPNCGIELTCVAIIMLREVIEERYIATPPANSANEPAIDTPSTLLWLILDPLDLRPTVYFEADLQRGSNLTAPQSQMTDTDTDYVFPRRSRISSNSDPQFYFDSST
jgi:hypothetical protein